jgi:uncharacterized RDD family membrane protein YckC
MSQDKGLYDRDLDNPYRAPVSNSAPSKAMEGEFVGYGGFWRRVAAHIIDQFVVFALLFAISLPFMVVAVALGGAGGLEGDEVSPAEIIVQLLSGVAQLAVLIAYAWGLPSSKYQATVGKMAMGMKVTDLYGQRISFMNAAGRALSKCISAIILYFGFFMIGWDERKQGLHDKIAGTLVLRTR